MEFAVTYRGQPWTSISVDIARAEAGEADVEWVDAIALTDVFGVTGPAQLPCLPLRFHVAQKLHGMTLPPRPGKQNERFRDLVDLLLMDAMITHADAALRAACELVFSTRNTHPWPPDLTVAPAHWALPFAALAKELELPDTDVEAALATVRRLVARILGAAAVDLCTALPIRTGVARARLLLARRQTHRGSRTGSRQARASSAPWLVASPRSQPGPLAVACLPQAPGSATIGRRSRQPPPTPTACRKTGRSRKKRRDRIVGA